MDGDESNQDNESFSNTLLELDNALSVYLFLSKLENSDSLQYLDMLLEASANASLGTCTFEIVASTKLC